MALFSPFLRRKSIFLYVVFVLAMLFIWPAVSLAASNPYDYSLFPGGAPSRLVDPSTGAPSTLSSQSSAGASKTVVNTGANAAKGANEACLATGVVYGTTPCWDFVGFIPIRGICLDRGVCKATAVGGIAGGFFQVGAQMVVGAFWGGIRNAFVGIPGTVSQPSQPQCPTRYRVTTPSSDPCAVYIPATATSTLNTSDALLRALGAQTSAPRPQPNIGNLLLNMVENIIAPVANRTPIYEEITPIEPGARGDIQLTTTGATIQAGIVDDRRNLEVSGFFGAKTLTDAPRTLAERMCIVRPWQQASVSAKIPVSVFDGVCSGKGFKTGLPAAAAVSIPAKAPISKPAAPALSATTTPAPATPDVKPAAAIWASPESVPLGSRTTIIWDSKGVVSCTVTSPDGNFNDDRKSGRASTVAIVGPTTFTISCLTLDGSHVTDFVRVNLAI